MRKRATMGNSVMLTDLIVPDQPTICSSIVHGNGCAADLDLAFRDSWNIDVVVAGAVVSDILQTLG